jgi:hypothetical protein
MVSRKIIIVDEGKWDYFFGRVTSSEHNQLRSIQNLHDLGTLGIKEANGGRVQLTIIFKQGLSAPEVSRVVGQHGTTVVRAVQIGGKGEILISYFYEGGNMAATPKVSTIIPKIFKQ